MKIVAALAWFDEPEGFLDRCVSSLVGLVDALVALDGPWEGFPHTATWSPGQANAIMRAAEGIPSVEVVQRDEAWPSQVAKRDALMTTADFYGDWILVVDADEFVTHADPRAVRSELARTDAVCANVGLTNLHRGRQLGGGLCRRVYRAGTTVEVVHSGYTFEGRHLLPGEPTLDLAEHLHLEHDYANRGEARNAQAREYIAARARERVEVWV